MQNYCNLLLSVLSMSYCVADMSMVKDLDSRSSAQDTFHYYDEHGSVDRKRPTVMFFKQRELPAIYWSNVHRCIYGELAQACRLRFEDVPCVIDYYGRPGHQLTVYVYDDAERGRRVEEIALNMHDFVMTQCLQRMVPTLRTYLHRQLEDRSHLARAVSAFTQKWGLQEMLLLLDQFSDVFHCQSILTSSSCECVCCE